MQISGQADRGFLPGIHHHQFCERVAACVFGPKLMIRIYIQILPILSTAFFSFHQKSMSSTSNTRKEFGGMTPG